MPTYLRLFDARRLRNRVHCMSIFTFFFVLLFLKTIPAKFFGILRYKWITQNHAEGWTFWLNSGVHRWNRALREIEGNPKTKEISDELDLSDQFLARKCSIHPIYTYQNVQFLHIIYIYIYIYWVSQTFFKKYRSERSNTSRKCIIWPGLSEQIL